ncbi:hypothetical protein Vadar_029177 [Vaccinium darrowii]|uniref:Uncharacterized protein n=1 Tax=Vaccinium darrowii TaxID=229202 RepID=A0ACB7Z7E5_9ERIC|nr:hypothetical protein Vadar_029177 [Vaccinium darrowii]
MSAMPSFFSSKTNSKMLLMLAMMFMTSVLVLFLTTGNLGQFALFSNSRVVKLKTGKTSGAPEVSKLRQTPVASTGDFNQDVEIYFGEEQAKILDNGRFLTLSLDNKSGSGFQSRNEYLFGRIDMQIKLVSGNSAGTVTTYYLSSLGSRHDEIDFEFLGNLSGQPYTVHTNIFSQGKGGREQQFHLWFDPTIAFHTYSIVWNPQCIILLVDDIPIRVFNNNEAIGVPFPTSQAMRVYSSLWNADEWATQGGRVKTDWTKAPFTAYYRNFKANACVYSSGSSSCDSSNSTSLMVSTQTWGPQKLDSQGKKSIRWAQKNFMIYNYCTDYKRFPEGVPTECKQSRYMQ